MGIDQVGMRLAGAAGRRAREAPAAEANPEELGRVLPRGERVPHPDPPGRARFVAAPGEDRAGTAVEESLVDALRGDDLGRTVERIPLAYAPQVEGQAGPGETDRPRSGIDRHPVERRRDSRPLYRLGCGHVEIALGLFPGRLTSQEDAEDLAIDEHRIRAGVAVYPGDLAPGIEPRKKALDSFDLVENGLGDRGEVLSVFTNKPSFEPGAHRGALALDRVSLIVHP